MSESSRSELDAVAPLARQHMGTENMGPLLYALVRFLKPRRVLEVGAGFTTLFILQARRARARGGAILSPLATRKLRRLSLLFPSRRRSPTTRTSSRACAPRARAPSAASRARRRTGPR